MSTIGNPVELAEQKRTYAYPTEWGIMTVTIADVIELIVRDSGAHRLKTVDGKLHYMPAGFVHIEIETEKKDWTV